MDLTLLDTALLNPLPTPIASGDYPCCFSFESFRREERESQELLRNVKKTSRITFKKNEHRFLVFQRKPQDFPADVSVFNRHTSLEAFRFF